MATFRRDKLRRLVEAGRVVTVGTYHFDDMMGESRGNKPMLCAMMPENRNDANFDGKTCYMFAHDFASKSGGCYTAGTQHATGFPLVCLHVHSNSNYDLVILPEGMSLSGYLVARELGAKEQ